MLTKEQTHIHVYIFVVVAEHTNLLGTLKKKKKTGQYTHTQKKQHCGVYRRLYPHIYISKMFYMYVTYTLRCGTFNCVYTYNFVQCFYFWFLVVRCDRRSAVWWSVKYRLPPPDICVAYICMYIVY